MHFPKLGNSTSERLILNAQDPGISGSSCLEGATHPFWGGYKGVKSYSFTVSTPKTIPICLKQRSKCIKYVPTVHLYCQSKWKLPGCGFNWTGNPSLAAQIYYSYTSPSGFHLGDESFRWWMRQYLYIILQSKQGDFQFKSTIGYCYILIMKTMILEKRLLYINNFLSCEFCISCIDQSIPFNSGGQMQGVTLNIHCSL